LAEPAWFEPFFQKRKRGLSDRSHPRVSTEVMFLAAPEWWPHGAIRRNFLGTKYLRRIRRPKKQPLLRISEKISADGSALL
jgi:hypothetical protein